MKYALTVYKDDPDHHDRKIFLPAWEEFYKRYVDVQAATKRAENRYFAYVAPKPGDRNRFQDEIQVELNTHLAQFGGRVEDGLGPIVYFNSQEEAMFFVLSMS